MIKLKKVISGGQTGIDQIGLIAASHSNILTGGWAPYNWMTEYGESKEFLKKLGLKPDVYDPKIYPIRTVSNIKDSNGTLIFTCGIKSPGTNFTIKICKLNKKPCLVIEEFSNETQEQFINWLNDNKIQILNIAGPRDSKISKSNKDNVFNFLVKCFQKL